MGNPMINVTLTAEEWNIVLHALSQRPFLEVNSLIYKVKNQADAQVELSQINPEPPKDSQ